MQAFTIILLFQGPTKLEALAGQRRPWCSATRRPTSPTGGRGRRRTSCASACWTSSPSELGIDPLDVRRRNYVVRDEPPLAMLTGQPVRRGDDPARRSSRRRALVDWDGFRQRQRAAREEGRYLGIGIAAVPRGGAGAAGARARRQADIVGDEATHLFLDDDGRLVIVTRQQPHGQGHETTLAQVAADELGVRFEDVERALRRHRHHADGARRHRREPGRHDGQRRRAPRVRASCAAKVLALAAELLEAERGRPRAHRGRDLRARDPVRAPDGRRAGPHRRRRARAAARRRRPRPGGDPHLRRWRIGLVGRHPLLHRRGRRRDRPRRHRALRRRRGLRRRRQPGDRRGPDPGRRRPGHRRRAPGARRLRRGRPVPGLHVHGLPAPDDDDRAQHRGPPRRDGAHRPRRELPRCRRGRDDRRPRDDRQRHRGRAGALRRTDHASSTCRPSRILELAGAVPAR